MKYKKKLKKLQDRQSWWDRQSPSYQKATKRPGSTKLK